MKNKQKRELAVCGFQAVKAVERCRPEAIRRLYFSSDRSRQFGELARFLALRGLPYNIASQEELERLSGSVHHQGVVAMTEERLPTPLTAEKAHSWVQRKERIVLLDCVGNANNLGSIVRSAAFFGIRHIILPLEEGQTGLTTSAYRTAQGGMEYVDFFSLHSAVRFLRDMDGKMLRLGADVHEGEDAGRLGSLCADRASVIILGNEEKGIKKDILAHCDKRIRITPAGNASPPIESLNVAQAASILFYEYTRTGNGR